MKSTEKKKLITTNAAIWAAGMLASFIAPMIADSMVDGRGGFLRMMAHILPLIIAMQASTIVINKAIGQPTD